MSFNSTIRSCKVRTDDAIRVESDRFLNQNNMVCIPWEGKNLKGQKVCPDSFNTKAAGCNSALDRVSVEITHRPHFSSYYDQNMRDLEGGTQNQTAINNNTIVDNDAAVMSLKYGAFGQQWHATNNTSCGVKNKY